MKTKEDILTEFGKHIVDNVYNESVQYFSACKSGVVDEEMEEQYRLILNKLSVKERNLLINYDKAVVRNAIFSFLLLFETYPVYKIIYEEDEEQVNLNQ